MRITLVGHACVLVELKGRTVLMDPVFFDPFEEGTVVSCPKRVVDVDKLPPIDTVVISHAHLDHFDIPTLARLPRTADVVFPKDQTIGYALHRLGFKTLRPNDPWQRLKGDGFELITTPSNVTNVTEFGIVFHDASGTFWNQVDSVLSDATVDTVRKLVDGVDLLFAMHASQNFGFFNSRNAGFPADMHRMNLSRVLRIQPKLTVPGAAGFRFAGALAWCNSFLFPVSREQFVADLALLDPCAATQIANPGDVFEIDGGTVSYRPQASPFVKMIEEDTLHLRYDPTAPLPPLADPNPEGRTTEDLEAAVEKVAAALWSYVSAASAGSDALIDEYRALRATYGLRVVFPNGEERGWRMDFSASPPTRTQSDGPCNAGHVIAASVLVAWAAHEKSYFYWRGYSRRYSALYAVARADDGVTLEPRDVKDLLEWYVSFKSERAEWAHKTRIDRELAPYLQATRP